MILHFFCGAWLGLMHTREVQKTARYYFSYFSAHWKSPQMGHRGLGAGQGVPVLIWPLCQTVKQSFQPHPRRQGDWGTTAGFEAGEKKHHRVCNGIPHTFSRKWVECPSTKSGFSSGSQPKVLTELACCNNRICPDMLIDLAIYFDQVIHNHQACWGMTYLMLVSDHSKPMQLRRTELSLTKRKKPKREKLCFFCGPVSNSLQDSNLLQSGWENHRWP